MLIYQWVNHFNHIGIRQSFFMVVHRGWPLGIYETMGLYHWLRLMGTWREITIKHGNLTWTKKPRVQLLDVDSLPPWTGSCTMCPDAMWHSTSRQHQAQRPQNGSSSARSCTHQAQGPQRTSIHRCRRSKRMLNHWPDTACAMCHTGVASIKEASESNEWIWIITPTATMQSSPLTPLTESLSLPTANMQHEWPAAIVFRHLWRQVVNHT